MIRVSRESLVDYQCDQMFDLVMDVERYPEFLRYCVGAKILQQSQNQVEARLDLARGPIHQSFTTRNTIEPNRRIDLALVEGPFKKFSGQWLFEELTGGCRIKLRMEFELKGMALKFLVAPLISEVANQMLDAMVRRARSIYVGS